MSVPPTHPPDWTDVKWPHKRTLSLFSIQFVGRKSTWHMASMNPHPVSNRAAHLLAACICACAFFDVHTQSQTMISNVFNVQRMRSLGSWTRCFCDNSSAAGVVMKLPLVLHAVYRYQLCERSSSPRCDCFAVKPVALQNQKYNNFLPSRSVFLRF